MDSRRVAPLGGRVAVRNQVAAVWFSAGANRSPEMGGTSFPQKRLGPAIVEHADVPVLVGIAPGAGPDRYLNRATARSDASRSRNDCPMNIAEHMLARGADSAAAVLSQNAVLTYDELRERVSQVANALLAQGHAKGDRLGIFAENGAFFVTAYLGIIRAGLVAVPLQNELTPEALTRMALDAGMSAVLVSKRLLNRANTWATQAHVRVLTELDLNNLSGTASRS